MGGLDGDGGGAGIPGSGGTGCDGKGIPGHHSGPGVEMGGSVGTHPAGGAPEVPNVKGLFGLVYVPGVLVPS